MLVRTLVGNRAGQIQDIATHAAQALLASGQAEGLSDAEIDAYEAQIDADRAGDEMPTDAPALVRRIESDASGRILIDRVELARRPSPAPVPAASIMLMLGELREVYGAATNEEVLRQLIDNGREAAELRDEDSLVIPMLDAEAQAAVDELMARWGTASADEIVKFALMAALAEEKGEDLPARPGSASGSSLDPLDIPEDWRTAHHSTRRKWANQISGEAPADTAEADEIIAVHLAAQA